MSSNDDESIVPILNQLKTFYVKWRAKIEQYKALESSLNLVNISNKELEDECERLKSSLNTSEAKIKEFEIKCEDVEASLNVTKTEKENFESKCIALESSLNQSNLKNKELETKYEAAELSLNAANVKIMNYDHKLAKVQSSLNLSEFQNKTFRSKCQNLVTTLSRAEAKNKELEQKNEIVESFLAQSNDKNRQLEIKCQALLESLRSANAKNQELKEKHDNIKSSLDAANRRNEELEIKLRSVESSLTTANASFKELDLKCMSLESLLKSADTKRKELEIKLNKFNEEIKKVQEQKNKSLTFALQKVQNKLTTNPLYFMNDKVKQNIQNLDKIKNPSFDSQNIVDVITVGDSDNDDDESTISFVSEQPNIEEDFNEVLSSQSEVIHNDESNTSSLDIASFDKSIKPFIRSKQNPTFNETNERDPKSIYTNLSESKSITSTPSTPCINRSSWKNSNENCDTNMRSEISDNSNGSDISLNICADVTEISENKVKNQAEQRVGINYDSLLFTKEKNIESNLDLELDSKPPKMFKILDSNNSLKQNVQNEVMMGECNENCPTLDEQVGKIVSNLIRKSDNKLKLLHPVVLLTPWEYEKDNVATKVSNQSKTSHVPSPSKYKSKYFTSKNSPEKTKT